MDQFADIIAHKWDISHSAATLLCKAYQEGDSPVYLSEYVSAVVAELSLVHVYSVFAFLGRMESLAPRRKRLKNALKKHDMLSDEVSAAIDVVTNGFELDDMIAQFRVNPRSKAQQAREKGLDPLAQGILQQDLDQEPEDAAAQYVDPSDKAIDSVDKVLEGATHIVVDTLAANESVRSLAREFTLEDGYVEIVPKKKYEQEYKELQDQQVELAELPTERLLGLLGDEAAEKIRLRISVNLFSIVELLKEHLIEDPDAPGLHILIEAIEECWNRSLHPLVEKQIKELLHTRHEADIITGIDETLNTMCETNKPSRRIVSVFQQDEKNTALVALDGTGNFLGASIIGADKKHQNTLDARLTQFYNRHRPELFLVHASGEGLQYIKDTLERIKSDEVTVARVGYTKQQLNNITGSSWMRTNYGDLDEPMKKAMASAILHCMPLSAVLRIGPSLFSLHPLQSLLPEEHLHGIVEQKTRMVMLANGIDSSNATAQELAWLPCIDEECAARLRQDCAAHNITSKQQLASVEYLSELAYRNSAGYLLFPGSDNPLDFTRVHPEHFDWINEICTDLDMSVRALINSPDALNSYSEGNYLEDAFIQRSLVQFLAVGKKHLQAAGRAPRRTTLGELKEGMIVSGVVTNITKFGVFVDINAEYDGLIHISQLADQYVETPEQVVSVKDMVNVRILKINPEKKRISLSMKNMGNLTPKVKASKGQLDNLAQHFKKR